MLARYRLILDPPRDATLNMAIDEMLMESQNSPDALPVLRFYSWIKPAYSIGYFQNVGEVAKKFNCERKKISVVRRLTGGGAVLHGNDLTFSLAVKKNNPFFEGQAKDSYLKINEVLRVGIKRLYPQIDYADCRNIPSGRGRRERICFEAPVCHDLLLEGKKVVGASQRRKHRAILHQSSIFLDADKNLLLKQILEGFKLQWNVEFEKIPLSGNELLITKQKQERYKNLEWAINY